MNLFDLNYQFQLYCERVGLPEEKMHHIQRKETKRAFMGAVGQILILQRDMVSRLPEAEAPKALQSLLDQVNDFWLKEVEDDK